MTSLTFTDHVFDHVEGFNFELKIFNHVLFHEDLRIDHSKDEGSFLVIVKLIPHLFEHHIPGLHTSTMSMYHFFSHPYFFVRLAERFCIIVTGTY